MKRLILTRQVHLCWAGRFRSSVSPRYCAIKQWNQSVINICEYLLLSICDSLKLYFSYVQWAWQVNLSVFPFLQLRQFCVYDCLETDRRPQTTTSKGGFGLILGNVWRRRSRWQVKTFSRHVPFFVMTQPWNIPRLCHLSSGDIPVSCAPQLLISKAE